ncbi:MAG: peptide deformylase [Oscillospiraceae bacterium]|nr:peptide deformylase [Oscillospiraceae bacterium]
MALRTVLVDDHPSLRKVCRPYTEFGSRLHQLLDDLKETMLAENGVGLAAPQVGILRRACVVLETNVPEGEQEYFIELVNPEIVSADGEQEGGEGCLSFPGRYGIVRRPQHVVVRAQDRNGDFFEVEGEGLTARAFCHEIDHLNGQVFIDKAERMLTEEELAELYGGDEEE